MAGRQGRVGVICLGLVAVMALTPGGSLAARAKYAPLNRPGPALGISMKRLRSALSCTTGVRHDARDPILLVPGTDLDPRPNFSWNYERAFAARHWAYCTVTLPAHATGDIQLAGKYVVYAIRVMARRSGHRVDVLGYSQGGMVPRWALRFWPDTRHLVRTFVALDPSNHGTADANATCQQQCSAADWQQAAGSHFMQALNSYAETFAGLNYTVVYSRTDEIVVPNLDSSGSSSLHTGRGRIRNIAVQQVCPGDTSDHLAMGTYDPVGYALAVNAFSHESVANPAAIPRTVCAQPFQPGVEPASFASNYATFLADIGRAQEGARQLSSEPPVDCYVFAGCRH